MNRRAFIGPIGDDLPSLIAVMLALTLFFSGLTFAMQTFNQKQEKVNLLKGSIDVSRALIKEPVISSTKDFSDDKEANAIAENNNLKFHANFISDFNEDKCKGDPLYFSYLVSKKDSNNINLDTLRICVWRSEQ